MKKGIVLEVHHDYITMLTPEGEFIKGKKLRDTYDIGEETTFFPYTSLERKKKSFNLSFRGWKLVSVLASILLVLSLLPRFTQSEVQAYVGLDINPSIEMAVNKKLQVIEMQAYNEDGQVLIALVDDWNKKHIHDVTKELIQLFREQGYMEAGKEIIITSIVTNIENLAIKAQIDKEVNELTNDIKQNEVKVTVIETSVENREKAKEQGMSAGKFVQQEQRENAVEVILEEEMDEVVEEDVKVTEEEQSTEDNSSSPPANKGQSKKEEKLAERDERKQQQAEKKNEMKNTNNGNKGNKNRNENAQSKGKEKKLENEQRKRDRQQEKEDRKQKKMEEVKQKRESNNSHRKDEKGRPQ
ncbi:MULTISPECIES: anti-sigma factor domain-containing protein [Sutcliffiella]|uniref:RsgI N-terminal anti-sigma domain-containing protein n=1 Tax=Sutcliffiella cohnii TaxID=33932 RepID=A0A223KPW9_9BACI|nr:MULTISPECIES: anti-sigma factor domain-containing protein [Sutcliffiella]AST91417.1 hypothetical protein BC6307_09045 [Sutcliffiella cohnii]MED4015027.1 anti-sigma factor domain-containing protein [Sutcliffiella cohnii]WBL17243.1 anti-sigma factor domain-containing protein [Sutcliffiella sp. NC1]